MLDKEKADIFGSSEVDSIIRVDELGVITCSATAGVSVSIILAAGITVVFISVALLLSAIE